MLFVNCDNQCYITQPSSIFDQRKTKHKTSTYPILNMARSRNKPRTHAGAVVKPKEKANRISATVSVSYSKDTLSNERIERLFKGSTLTYEARMFITKALFDKTHDEHTSEIAVKLNLMGRNVTSIAHTLLHNDAFAQDMYVQLLKRFVLYHTHNCSLQNWPVALKAEELSTVGKYVLMMLVEIHSTTGKTRKALEILKLAPHLHIVDMTTRKRLMLCAAYVGKTKKFVRLCNKEVLLHPYPMSISDTVTKLYVFGESKCFAEAMYHLIDSSDRKDLLERLFACGFVQCPFDSATLLILLLKLHHNELGSSLYLENYFKDCINLCLNEVAFVGGVESNLERYILLYAYIADRNWSNCEDILAENNFRKELVGKLQAHDDISNSEELIGHITRTFVREGVRASRAFAKGDGFFPVYWWRGMEKHIMQKCCIQELDVYGIMDFIEDAAISFDQANYKLLCETPIILPVEIAEELKSEMTKLLSVKDNEELAELWGAVSKNIEPIY